MTVRLSEEDGASGRVTLKRMVRHDGASFRRQPVMTRHLEEDGAP